VNGAERGDTIDRDAAKAAFADAESRVGKAGENKQAQFQAEKDLKRARARLQAAGGVT
jgi:F-type H+-transporting ATPase subunit epsilon